MLAATYLDMAGAGGNLPGLPPRLPIDPDDAALMGAIAGGDRQALARLYDRHAGTLLAVGIRMLGSRREAEDVLHDVFLELWRRSADYDAARGTVRTWIAMRMRSRSLDRLKSAAFSRTAPIDEVGERGPTSDDDPAMAADRTRVRRALAGLPPEQRAVLELAYFEGLSSQEMAARLAIPMGTVKSRVAAGLAKLRAELGPTGGEA